MDGVTHAVCQAAHLCLLPGEGLPRARGLSPEGWRRGAGPALPQPRLLWLLSQVTASDEVGSLARHPHCPPQGPWGNGEHRPSLLFWGRWHLVTAKYQLSDPWCPGPQAGAGDDPRAKGPALSDPSPSAKPRNCLWSRRAATGASWGICSLCAQGWRAPRAIGHHRPKPS